MWRNGLYHKIKGTVINVASQSPTCIHEYDEYDNFASIPVLAGGVLGVFIPQTMSSKLRALVRT